MNEFIFHIENHESEIIISNLLECCRECILELPSNCSLIESSSKLIKRRNGKLTTRKGYTFLCSNEFKTSKLFKQMLQFINYSIPWLNSLKDEIKRNSVEIEQKQTRRLLHNLTSLNAHNIQEIYDFIPQEILIKNIKDQMEIIQNMIEKEPKKATTLFYRIVKNNMAIKTEISVFRKLYDKNPKLDTKSHNVKNIILLVLHTFFQDFTDKGVYINVMDNETRLDIDFESFRVAMYHIIDNSLKYTKPNSTIDITFQVIECKFLIYFAMESLIIKEDELLKIFDEGYSGFYAKHLKMNGEGIGMTMVKELLKLNSSEIKVFSDFNEKNKKFNKIHPYSNNTFVVTINIE